MVPRLEEGLFLYHDGSSLYQLWTYTNTVPPKQFKFNDTVFPRLEGIERGTALSANDMIITLLDDESEPSEIEGAPPAIIS